MLNNIIDYIAMPKCYIKLDKYKINSIKGLFKEYNLCCISDPGEFIFINDILEIHISKNGNMIVSFEVPPEKTERGIILLDNIVKQIYLILSKNCDMSVEIHILDNNNISIEKLTNKSFNSKQISLKLEAYSDSRVIINSYKNNHVLSFTNFIKIEDMLELYSYIKHGHLKFNSKSIVTN